MDVRTDMLVFQDFERLTEFFAPGRPPGYPRGRGISGPKAYPKDPSVLKILRR